MSANDANDPFVEFFVGEVVILVPKNVRATIVEIRDASYRCQHYDYGQTIERFFTASDLRKTSVYDDQL